MTIAVLPAAETAPNAPKKKRQLSEETKMCHATENAVKDLFTVQDLEVQLQINVRWNQESEEWKATTVLLMRCPSANQGDSENGLQSPQLMAIGHTCYDGPGISQVKSQHNICDHKASSDSQFTMEFMIGYNLVSDSNLS